jgi:putative Holliday junction resolvase
MPGTPEAASRKARSGRNHILLAFDFGLRRIGVATGNLLTRTAAPLTALESGREPPWSAIDSVVAEYAPGRLVVGVPEASSAPTAITQQARRFAAELAARYALPVDTVDEALSSRAAESELRDARRSGTRGKRIDRGGIDAQAAKIIAEQWINSRAERGETS